MARDYEDQMKGLIASNKAKDAQQAVFGTAQGDQCAVVINQVPRGPAFEDWLDKYVPKGGPPNLHPEQPAAGAPCARAGGGHGLEGKIDNR